MEGTGASQMQRGIPQLHSLMADASVLSDVGVVFECISTLMSSLEIAFVMLFAPSDEGGGSDFPDL